MHKIVAGENANRKTGLYDVRDDIRGWQTC